MAIGNTTDLERRLYVANGELGKDQNGNPFNYVDGALAGIYFYDDPGNAEKKVMPCTKLCIELVDTDKDGNEHRYVVIGRYDGFQGAASWFATTVADGLEHVTPGEWCRISVKAATGNNKVTFANVDKKVGNSWQRQRSETNYSTVEPQQRGEMTHALITGHPAFYKDGKPAETVQEPPVGAEVEDDPYPDAEQPQPDADPQGGPGNDPRGAPRGAKGGFFAIAKSIGIPMGGDDTSRTARHLHYSAVLGRAVNSGTELTDADWSILFEDAKKRQAEGAEEDPNYDPFASLNQPAQNARAGSPTPVEDDTLTYGVYETMVSEASELGIKMHIRAHREKWAMLAKLEGEPGWIESGHWREIKDKAETTKKLAAVIAEMKSKAVAK